MAGCCETVNTSKWWIQTSGFNSTEIWNFLHFPSVMDESIILRLIRSYISLDRIWMTSPNHVISFFLRNIMTQNFNFQSTPRPLRQTDPDSIFKTPQYIHYFPVKHQRLKNHPRAIIIILFKKISTTSSIKISYHAPTIKINAESLQTLEECGASPVLHTSPLYNRA